MNFSKTISPTASPAYRMNFSKTITREVSAFPLSSMV
jgi:hypothetical protein